MSGETPDKTENTMNTIADIKIIFRRPNLSESCPANAPPKIAPNITAEVIQPTREAAFSRCQSACKKGKAPVITPIS